MATLGERIRQRREQIGLTQEKLAVAVGIKQQSIQAIESGKAQGTKHLVKIATALQLRPEQIESDEPLPTAAIDGPPAELPRPPITEVLPKATPAGFGGRDLPIYGKAHCGPEGYVSFPQNAIDWYWRPPELAGVRDAFAIYAEGDSMEDAAPAGSVVIVHPHRGPRPGDLCLVLRKDDGAQVKFYVGRKRGKVILRQENPRGEIEFAEDAIQALYLVIGVMRR